MPTAFLYDKNDKEAQIFMDGKIVPVPLDQVPKDIQPGADFEYTAPAFKTVAPLPQDAPPAATTPMDDTNPPPKQKSLGGAAQRQQYAMQKLVGLGWTPVQAAGAVGRFMQEAYPDLRTGAVGDAGMSIGIGQWNGQRRKELISFAKKKGTSPMDLDTQLEYFDWEIRNKETTAYNALKDADTVDDASAAMMHYERPRGYKPNNPALGHGYDNTVQNTASVLGTYDPTAVITIDPRADQGSNDSIPGGAGGLDETIDPGDIPGTESTDSDSGGSGFTPPDLSMLTNMDTSADDQLIANGRQRIQNLLAQGRVADSLPTEITMNDLFGQG